MGYVGNDANKGVWMTLNGGQMSLAGSGATVDAEPAFDTVKIDSGGYGILDCDYRNPNEAWAVGGGGTMYRGRGVNQNMAAAPPRPRRGKFSW